MAEAAEHAGRRVFLPPRELCTDNGAMIAAAAWWRLVADGPTSLGAGIDQCAGGGARLQAQRQRRPAERQDGREHQYEQRPARDPAHHPSEQIPHVTQLR